MLELTVGLLILTSLVIYAVMGGADYGAGIWDRLASGPRKAAQRAAIDDAIGPIWEANHVWLILVLVLLFSAFPRGFAVMMTAFNIPITVMLIGIVLRGSAFVFKKYDLKDGHERRRWDRTFGFASIVTPLVQGMTLGGLAAGDVRVTNGIVTTGFWAGWGTPFAMSCGVFAVALFAFLAAVYLTIDTAGHSELQNDFRRNALISGAALGPVALIVFLLSKSGAPIMYAGLTQWWAPVLLAWTSLFAIGAFIALWQRWFVIARIAAIGQVTLILAGWCLAYYPNIVAPDVTIANSAAPETVLRVLVIAVGIGAAVLVPSLVFLFVTFKRR